ncbi:uncharacterized protein [Primulina huaijiensis]|uniref:uncharacterized protein n=1 Tax=Primulina huaijiensis TaxID=1492673 RepID=UPI003CC783F1
MTSFRKLKIGSHDDDTIHEPSKRLGQPALIGKGKEKIASTSTDKSIDGKKLLESIDTETTKTSRGRTHLDKLSRQRVQGIRKKLTFDVPPSWKKGCLSSANSKWRQFKSHLTQTFISNKVDKPEELDQPPTGYGLARDDWISFVMTRMYDKFIEVNDQQKKRRKKNIYPHRLARKGYARFAEEIASELCDDDDINRAIISKKGRVNKEGDSDVQELQVIVENIVSKLYIKINYFILMKPFKVINILQVDDRMVTYNKSVRGNMKLKG